MAPASPDAPISGFGPSGADKRRPTLSICIRCRDEREEANGQLRGGARLAQAVLEAGIDQAALDVRGVRCISQCKRSCAIALSGPDRFTYIFGDLDPTQHAKDVVDMARNDRPAPMRAGVLGRVPPLMWSGDAVETITLTSSNLKEPCR